MSTLSWVDCLTLCLLNFCKTLLVFMNICRTQSPFFWPWRANSKTDSHSLPLHGYFSPPWILQPPHLCRKIPFFWRNAAAISSIYPSRLQSFQFAHHRHNLWLAHIQMQYHTYLLKAKKNVQASAKNEISSLFLQEQRAFFTFGPLYVLDSHHCPLMCTYKNYRQTKLSLCPLHEA